jgi:alpha-L-fucosidase
MTPHTAQRRKAARFAACPQLNELASHYGKIDIMWFDGGGEDWLGFGGIGFKGGWKGRERGQHYSGSFSWQDDQVVDDLRKLQPTIIINGRTDAPADFRLREGDKAHADGRSIKTVVSQNLPWSKVQR